MSISDSKTRRILTAWFVSNTLLSGLLALLWLMLRSGPRPSRLAYPCQQAAFTTASLAFGAPLVGALITARHVAGRLIRNPRVFAAAAVGLFVTIGLWGFLSRSNASSAYGLQPPAGYRAEVFHVSECPPNPVGDRFPGLDALLQLMGDHGLKFYQSSTTSQLSGPDGLIASNDVVVLKINYQWGARGGTNTDMLRGLIRALVDHPDGFTGEIVIGENAQFAGVDDFDRSSNNAEDRTLSPHDVAVYFQGLGYRVSLSDWTGFRRTETPEGVPCHERWGYVVKNTDAGRVSYPRFWTDEQTCVDLAHGVWDTEAQAWDRSRLKFINLPVLKPHTNTYGVTACVKNFMGVVTNELNTGSHEGVGGGLLGAVMAEIGLPDLNILDCIWTSGHPGTGPEVGYAFTTRSDQLVASTDPIAADIWATTNILIPAFLDNGYSPPWPRPDPDPENPNSIFRNYLDRSMEWLLADGYSVTNDIDSIDAYTKSAARRRGNRRPSQRISADRPFNTPEVLQ